MALQPQNLSLSFGKGLDTKTDPNQVMPGKLLELENCVFNIGSRFDKRNGYVQLADIDQGVNISTFKGELTAFNGTSLQSYSPSNSTAVDKGEIIGLDVSVQAIYRNASAQTYQNSALHPTGIYLFVWTDSLNNSQYMIVSQSTGTQITNAIDLPSTAIYPKAWAIGNYLIVTYVDTSGFRLRYISIPVINPSAPNAARDLSTQVDSTHSYYDGVIVSDTLYLTWNASDGGGAIRLTFLNAQLNQGPTNIYTGEIASACIGIFADSSVTIPTIWVTYHNGTELKYFVISTNALTTTLAPTVLIASTNVLNVCGYATANTGYFYYQNQNFYSYAPTIRSDYVSKISGTTTGTVGSSEYLLRSVGLTSKVFAYNGNFYLVVTQDSDLQPTYFVINTSGVLIGKIAYSNGGGYAPQSYLTEVNSVTDSSFQFAYLFKSSLTTQSGEVFSQTGVNSAIIAFDTNFLFLNSELGQNLNITGGFLWAYDGARPVEQNFHIFPENLSYSAATASTGVFANIYSYQAIYEWTDNQGNIHRSAPSIAINVPLSAATSGITVSVPNLRLTEKSNVRFGLYRNAPSVAPTIFYRVNPISAPILSSTAADFTNITDSTQDAQLVGNELLYTTGGVVENTGGPSSVAISTFKNRIMLIDSENRNSIWYSKQVLQGTPVEMSDVFKLFVDPRFGEASAIAPMDDKFIVFKPNAIFYYTGNGPDATGGNNDFSESTFITSTVGCANPKSIILTPVGLMFQSNKGIWLLNRSLQESYIGADVQAYNDVMITSAVLIPNTTQVRFTLSSGIALVYDYYYQIWGTFTNHPAVGSTIFQSLFTYIKANGNIYQEALNTYTDNGVPFFIKLKTAPLSMAGLQGYQRAYGVYLLAKFQTPHVLNVSMAYNYSPYISQQAKIMPRDLINPAYGDDPYYGSTQYYGGVDRREQYLVSFTTQKCQSVSITIQEAIDTANVQYGSAVSLEALDLLVGVKGGYPRLPPNKSVS